jgi:hypothetical protein
VATAEFRLDVVRVVSPVTPNKDGSAVELGEFETNDAAILHDPVEIVTGTVAWRPERAEAAFIVHIPLPMGAPFVLDVCGATTGFEGLSGTVVIAKLPAVKAVAMCSVLTGSPSATARFSSAWTIFSSEGLLIRRGACMRWTIFLLKFSEYSCVLRYGSDVTVRIDASPRLIVCSSCRVARCAGWLIAPLPTGVCCDLRP